MIPRVSAVKLRVTYARASELRADTEQMTHGGMIVKVGDAGDLAFDAPIDLELVLPDGSVLATTGKVLQVLAGLGVAVTIEPEFAAEVRKHASGQDAPGAAPARHERVGAEPAARPAPAVPAIETMTTAQKIQLALHGNRDQRNAILRDTNRTLHAYVLKNPQIHVDDVLAMAKNTQLGPEVYKQIAERREWFQRPQIALALARNPKVPPDVGVRALDYVPADALRQIAKGTGAMPHVVTAARKKVLGK